MPGYFNFDKMISTTLIKATYAVGMILITLGSLAYAALGVYNYSNAPAALRQSLEMVALGHLVFGFAAIILGNLVWRVLCETWILLFSMHDHLSAVHRELLDRRNNP